MFYVIELQTTASTGAVVPFSFSDRDDAEAKYHTLLAVAAKSNVPKHTVMLLGADGFVLKSETYIHEAAE